MCGRIALINPDENKLKLRFKIKKVVGGIKPHFNIAPQSYIPAILNVIPDEICMVKWGLIPHWAKGENTKYSMINARAETITEKPAYRTPIKKQRCLILADTFYEWQKVDGRKKPYRFSREDEEVFAFAGVWDCWKKDQRQIESCSIITKEADQFMKPYHDRMPVILSEENRSKWLEDIALNDVMDIVHQDQKIPLKTYEISTMVNSPANDSEEILNPV